MQKESFWSVKGVLLESEMSHCENMLSLTPPLVIRTFMVTCTGKTVISTFFTKKQAYNSTFLCKFAK